MPRKLASPTPHGGSIKTTVLVVDDEHMICMVLSRMLGKTYNVIAMQSAVDALQLIAQHNEIDVILCDINMPEMSGVDVYNWVAANKPDLAKRMLFLTGGDFTARTHAFLDSREDRRIDKPFTIACMIGKISEVLTQSSAATA